MNIWHDLSPKRVRPEDFVALISKIKLLYKTLI